MSEASSGQIGYQVALRRAAALWQLKASSWILLGNSLPKRGEKNRELGRQTSTGKHRSLCPAKAHVLHLVPQEKQGGQGNAGMRDIAKWRKLKRSLEPSICLTDTKHACLQNCCAAVRDVAPLTPSGQCVLAFGTH